MTSSGLDLNADNIHITYSIVIHWNELRANPDGFVYLSVLKYWVTTEIVT
jgi:hypothetical protein